MNRISTIAGVIFITLLVCSCSGGNGIEPDTADNQSITETSNSSQSQRLLWGLWDISFDIDGMKATVTPSRIAQPHWNITPMISPPACNDCVQVKINSFNPMERILDADVTLINPTTIGAYDVRGIVFTDDAGHLLVNPDDWTKLWDVPGGMNINPFRAYAKDEPNRYFAGSSSHVEKFNLYIPKPPAWAGIKYAVDVSWPGNCKEPYMINSPASVGISSNPDTHTYMQVDVFDWQDDVSNVEMKVSGVTGPNNWSFQHVDGPTWDIDMVNHEEAPPGEYQGIIEAWSTNAGSIVLYDTFTVLVQNGWARTWGGPANDSCSDVASGPDGSIYVTGFFEGTCDFDPGPGIEEHTSNGLADIFLCKYNPNGELAWALTFGGGENDYGNAIAVDNSGFIYIAGNFRETVDFDPGPGAKEHTSNGESDFFLVSFDYDGNFSWAQTWGSTGAEYMWDVGADNLGNVFTSGAYFETTDFDPGPGTDDHTPEGMSDAFVSKFSTDGTWQWAQTWGGAESDSANSLAFDELGDIYLAGNYMDTVDFDPSPETDSHVAVGGLDAYLTKFNTKGNFLWAKTWGGIYGDMAVDVASDGYNSVYTVGHFSDIVNFNTDGGTDEQPSEGSFDEFLCRHNLNGDYQYAYTWGGSAEDRATTVAVDTYGDVYVAGNFSSDYIDFFPGPGVAEGSAPNDYQYAHLSKFNPLGGFEWVALWGSDSADDDPLAVCADHSGTAYVAGDFFGKADFDPGPGVDEHTPDGTIDACLSKFPSDGSW